MKFVSIDSSMANTGIVHGVIGPTGLIIPAALHLIETSKTKNKQVRASSDTIERCRATYKFVHQILKDVGPAVVFVETPSGSQSSAGMKSYGITCQLIASIDPAPIELSPDDVKKGSVGSKTASKRAIIEWAHGMYPDLNWETNKDGSLKNKNEHLADAIAIVHAGVKTKEFSRLFSTYYS